MPNAPSMDLFVTISSGSLFSKSTGVATWKTPLQPSMATLKLSGLLRSAFRICSFWDAPGKFVRKLTSLFCPASARNEQNYNLSSMGR